MKKYLLAIVLLTLVAPSLALFSVGAQVGYLAPSGTYADAFTGGMTTNLRFSLGLIPIIDVNLNVMYVEGTVNDDNDLGIPEQEMNSIVPITVQGKLKLPGILSPYFVGGVGLYLYDLSYTDTDTGEEVDRSGAEFGFNAGIGFEVGFLGFLGAYADGTYHWADTEPATVQCFTFTAGFYVGF